MQYRQLRKLLAAAVALVLVLGASPSAGFAADDYFGDGDGHHGSKSVTAPEVVNAYSRVAVDVAVNDTSIEVADGTKFNSGDLVFVWQVNGYSTPASGDQTAGGTWAVTAWTTMNVRGTRLAARKVPARCQIRER